MSSDPALVAALRKVAAGPQRKKDLTMEEARAASDAILAGTATPAQVGALLIALRVKEETAEELAGFALGLRQHCAAVPSLPGPLIDTAGAYDGRVRTLPVGPAASLACRRAGIHFLLHGIEGLGRAGTTGRELLAALDTAAGPEAATDLAEGSITYLDQRDYAPALASLLPIRNELGLRTAFNTAEKLVGLGRDGVGERSLLVGVFHGGYIRTVAEAARLAGFHRALVVQGLEGSEDVNVTRDSRVCEIRDGELREWPVVLEEIGITRVPADALACCSVSDAVSQLRPALRGEPGAAAEALVLSMAARLYLAGRAQDLRSGAVLARRLLGEGAGVP